MQKGKQNIKKQQYRVRNWKDYNKALVNGVASPSGSIKKLLKCGSINRNLVTAADRFFMPRWQYSAC